MQIFLLILKVLGILILSILGILVTLIFLILFAPVHYQIEGRIEENFKLRLKGKAGWLLFAAAIHFSYIESEFLHEIRIFGIRYKKQKKGDTEDLEEEISEEALKEENLKIENSKKEPAAEGKRIKDEKKPPKKKSRLQKLIQKLKAFFAELKLKIAGVFEFFKNIKEKISDIKIIVSDETNRKAAGLLWTEIKYLLHHFKFRKIDTDLTFGTDDPANTGQIMGILCMFPVLYQYHFHLYPDFEADRFFVTGDFKIAGRVRCIHIFISFIRLIKEKEVRAFIKKKE